eukprot:jgi/Undpi1/4128/HiC_scaffold_16.g07495.m1
MDDRNLSNMQMSFELGLGEFTQHAWGLTKMSLGGRIGCLAGTIAGAVFLHGYNIGHNDLKPENVIIFPGLAGTGPNAKLIDLGLALVILSTRLGRLGGQEAVGPGSSGILSPEAIWEPHTPYALTRTHSPSVTGSSWLCRRMTPIITIRFSTGWTFFALDPKLWIKFWSNVSEAALGALALDVFAAAHMLLLDVVKDNLERQNRRGTTTFEVERKGKGILGDHAPCHDVKIYSRSTALTRTTSPSDVFSISHMFLLVLMKDHLKRSNMFLHEAFTPEKLEQQRLSMNFGEERKRMDKTVTYTNMMTSSYRHKLVNSDNMYDELDEFKDEVR